MLCGVVEDQADRAIEGTSLNGATVLMCSSIQVTPGMVTWRLAGRRSKGSAEYLPAEDGLDKISPTGRGNGSWDAARIRAGSARAGVVENEGVNDSLDISCALE